MKLKQNLLDLRASTSLKWTVVERLAPQSPATEPLSFHVSPETMESMQFYFHHYDIVCQYVLKPGEKYELGERANQKCRFCGQSEPDVTFKTLAHALPEALGNKSLSSNYECDDCNHAFGIGIETHLGKWSKPMRTMARIRGKNGYATMEKQGGGWKIRSSEAAGFYISAYEDDLIFDFDEVAQRLKLTIPVEPYIPFAVLKAFWKIAITLMPEDELENFVDVRRWIMEKVHKTIGKIAIFECFQPGPMPNNLIGLMLLLRKSDDRTYPYAFLAIRYGNQTFQVPVPSATLDEPGESRTLPFFRFPDLIDPAVYGEAKFGARDLSSAVLAREPVEVTMHAQMRQA